MSDDLFADHDPRRRVAGRLAPVLLFAGGAGGLGNTSLAICTAQLAATLGKMDRVVLIDADLTRSDVATILRAPASLPTAATVAITGAIDRAFLAPGTLNAHRPAHVPDVSFHAVLLPSDPSIRSDITPHQITQIVEAAQKAADLVVVNLGPADPRPGSLVNQIVLPLLRQGAWLSLTTEPSPTSLANTEQSLQFLTDAAGITRDRLSVVVSRLSDAVKPDQAAAFTKRLSKMAHPMGSIEENTKVGADLRSGSFPLRGRYVSPVLAGLLLRVTGRPELEETAAVKDAPRSEVVIDEENDVPVAVTRATKSRRMPWKK